MRSVNCLVLLLLVTWINTSCSSSQHSKSNNNSPASIKVGARAPDLKLVNAQGETRNLSDYRGKVVFLNFWASWCVVCRQELPNLSTLEELVDHSNFKVLAVSLDEDRTRFVNFCNNDLSGLELWNDYKGQAKEMIQSNMLPVSLVIDKNGRIVHLPDPDTAVIQTQFSGPKNWSNPVTLSILRAISEN